MITIRQNIHLVIPAPKWAKWYACDRFGVWVAFENRPEIWPGIGDGMWHAPGRHKDILQFDSQSYRGWKKSLRSLNQEKSPK